MKAESSVYIRLQNIYKTKARQDFDEVLKIVQATPDGQSVDPAEVELFCKNAAFVKLINATGPVDQLATVVGKSFSLACLLGNVPPPAVSTASPRPSSSQFRFASASGGKSSGGEGPLNETQELIYTDINHVVFVSFLVQQPSS